MGAAPNVIRAWRKDCSHFAEFTSALRDRRLEPQSGQIEAIYEDLPRRHDCRLPIICACVLAILASGCSDPQGHRETSTFASGNAAFDQKQYGEAVIAYRNALKAEPMFAPARRKLAEALEKTGDLSNAGREFIRVADLLPNDAEAQLQASRYLIAVGSPIREGTRPRGLERASQIEDPRMRRLHILLGTGRGCGTDDFDAAMKQIQEAIDLDPTKCERPHLHGSAAAQQRTES